jgi:hypothetical protein
VCYVGSRVAIFLALPALVVGRNQTNCPTGSPKISRICIAGSESKMTARETGPRSRKRAFAA